MEKKKKIGYLARQYLAVRYKDDLPSEFNRLFDRFKRKAQRVQEPGYLVKGAQIFFTYNNNYYQVSPWRLSCSEEVFELFEEDLIDVALEPRTTKMQDVILADVDVNDFQTISYLLSSSHLKGKVFETEWGGFLMMYGGEYERPFPSVMIWRFENLRGENTFKRRCMRRHTFSLDFQGFQNTSIAKALIFRQKKWRVTPHFLKIYFPPRISKPLASRISLISSMLY